MALVRVLWETTERWEAEVEVDGYPDEQPSDGDLAELEGDGKDAARFIGCMERDVLQMVVVRAGEQPLSKEAQKIRAPRHEPDWED